MIRKFLKPVWIFLALLFLLEAAGQSSVSAGLANGSPGGPPM